jgi:hypothetical protein
MHPEAMGSPVAMVCLRPACKTGSFYVAARRTPTLGFNRESLTATYRFCTGVKPVSPRAFFIQTLPAKHMIQTADAFGRNVILNKKHLHLLFIIVRHI